MKFHDEFLFFPYDVKMWKLPQNGHHSCRFCGHPINLPKLPLDLRNMFWFSYWIRDLEPIRDFGPTHSVDGFCSCHVIFVNPPKRAKGHFPWVLAASTFRGVFEFVFAVRGAVTGKDCETNLAWPQARIEGVSVPVSSPCCCPGSQRWRSPASGCCYPHPARPCVCCQDPRCFQSLQWYIQQRTAGGPGSPSWDTAFLLSSAGQTPANRNTVNTLTTAECYCHKKCDWSLETFSPSWKELELHRFVYCFAASAKSHRCST